MSGENGKGVQKTSTAPVVSVNIRTFAEKIPGFLQALKDLGVEPTENLLFLIFVVAVMRKTSGLHHDQILALVKSAMMSADKNVEITVSKGTSP